MSFDSHLAVIMSLDLVWRAAPDRPMSSYL